MAKISRNRPRRTRGARRLACAIALAPSAWAASAAPARAQLTQVNIFNNLVYDQTSSAAPTTPAGAFFNFGALETASGDFTAASATYPGAGSPQALTLSGTTFGYGSPLQSLPASAAAYPFGTYVITATGGTHGPAGGTINYTADHFASAIPALSASTYATLNSYNPVATINAVFNAFTQAPGATEAYTFFTIFNESTSAVVVSDLFLDPSTTSVTIPGGTLAPNTTYGFELDFSDRLIVDATDVSPATYSGSDVRTDGTFTTGPLAIPVPEPGSLALLAAALAGLGVARGKRRIG